MLDLRRELSLSSGENEASFPTDARCILACLTKPSSLFSGRADGFVVDPDMDVESGAVRDDASDCVDGWSEAISLRPLSEGAKAKTESQLSSVSFKSICSSSRADSNQAKRDSLYWTWSSNEAA